MTKKEIVLGVVALLATLCVGLVIGLNITKKPRQIGSAQTAPTYLTDSGTLNSQGSLLLWDIQSGGGLEVKGTSYLSTTTLYGPLTSGGTAEAQTSVATSTLSASSVCSDSFLSITPVSSTPTITFPSTSTLFASCLGTLGQTRTILYKAINTSTIFAAGAGGTILNSSSNTVAANKGAEIRIVHDTALTYLIYLVNVVN